MIVHISLIEYNDLNLKMFRPKQLRRLKSTYVPEHDYTINPNTYIYTTIENQDLFDRFPLITAKSHQNKSNRPRRSKMLGREFIEDSMYNLKYGYFSKSAEIFSPSSKFDVARMSNVDEFIDRWALEYRKQTPNSAEITKNNGEPVKHHRTVSKQLWHTPSELFSPHYGNALARYIIEQHLKNDEGKLEIYETGAGNGTLMLDILNYIRQHYPEIYSNLTYNVIEISNSLSLKQKALVAGHSEEKVNIYNMSILDWNLPPTKSKCFIISLEMWDNLAHDVIRYDNTTLEPFQGYVVIDHNGSFTEVYSPKLDKWASLFLKARGMIDFKPQRLLGWHPLKQPAIWRQIKNMVIPFKGNLSSPEYIPTRFFQMLHILREKFPNHHMIASDFTHFTERIEGYQSPVVQTFMEGLPVTMKTYMVLQGFFDIMFPTDFLLAKQLYMHVTGKEASVTAHGEFLRKYVTEDAKTKAGELPILDFYRNAAFFTTQS